MFYFFYFSTENVELYPAKSTHLIGFCMRICWISHCVLSALNCEPRLIGRYATYGSSSKLCVVYMYSNSYTRHVLFLNIRKLLSSVLVVSNVMLLIILYIYEIRKIYEYVLIGKKRINNAQVIFFSIMN